MCAHVPEDGNVFLFFAPHIGIDNNGNCGKITREGQKKISTACGAAIGAYNFVKKSQATLNTLDLKFDHTDY